MHRRRFLLALGAAPLAACRMDTPPEPSPRGAAPGARSVPVPSASGARAVTRVVDPLHTRDGAGVRLARTVGSPSLSELDPFLLLDEIRSDRPEDYEKGFPTHPHRGFETVTYMIEGAMEHADSVGNRGRLVAGSAQWMTAGRGIVHSEMPKQEKGLLWGLQLWVNLPKRLKMTAPRYQDVAPSRIPEVAASGARVRVAAGAAGGATGPVEGIATAPAMLDVRLEAATPFEHPLPREHAAFVYVLSGALELGSGRTPVGERRLAVLGPGDTLVARSAAPARFLLLAAAPIGEPIARSGPFVMSTEAECEEAWADYRAGRLGT